MATLAYHASQEQFSPSQLLDFAIKAEQAGFNAIHSSDHFHPWSKRQGQSGFTFSWIAAAMQATSLPFSMVCAPGQRYHPAIVAQAVATLSELFPSRFSVELGSGEALNECITGAPWPEKSVRNARLLESVQVIRGLLAGEEISLSGHIKVKEAKLYTLPPSLPPIFGCALSVETATWIGEWADGLLMGGGELSDMLAMVNGFRENGGEGKPIYIQLAFSYARSAEAAVMSAWEQWRSNLVSMDQLANLTKPEQFDEAGRAITPDQVIDRIPIFTSIREIRDKVRSIENFCAPDRIILHNVSQYQDDFIQDFGSYCRDGK